MSDYCQLALNAFRVLFDVKNKFSYFSEIHLRNMRNIVNIFFDVFILYEVEASTPVSGDSQPALNTFRVLF